MFNKHEIVKKIGDSPALHKEEKILVGKRQHWFLLIVPVFFSIIIAITTTSSFYHLFILKISQIGLFISLALVAILITESVITTIKEVRKDQIF